MTLEYVQRTLGQGNSQGIVIWLHGLGANGHDFVGALPHLQLPADLCLDFYFPHAPSLPVSINAGMIMPAWYDILSMDFEREVDLAQIERSSQAIVELIAKVNETGLPIILAGFSQGAAMVLHLALSQTLDLKGVLALSGYLADPSVVKAVDCPIALHHGEQDAVVPFRLGQQGFTQLQGSCEQLSFHPWPGMGHEVNVVQLQQIGQWLQQCLRD